MIEQMISMINEAFGEKFYHVIKVYSDGKETRAVARDPFNEGFTIFKLAKDGEFEYSIDQGANWHPV